MNGRSKMKMTAAMLVIVVAGFCIITFITLQAHFAAVEMHRSARERAGWPRSGYVEFIHGLPRWLNLSRRTST